MKQRKCSAFSSHERLRFSRKAQGLPLNTIIIAALGIIVLFILAIMVQTQLAKRGKELKVITEATCAPNEVQPLGTECQIIYGSFKDVPSGSICCRAGTVEE